MFLRSTTFFHSFAEQGLVPLCPEMQFMAAAVFHCVSMQINTPMMILLKMGIFRFWRSLSHKLWPWHCLYLCLFLAGSKWSDGRRSSCPASCWTQDCGQHWSRSVVIFSRQVMKVSKDRNFTASLGSLVWSCITLPVALFTFLNLPRLSLLLVMSCSIVEKSLPPLSW